MRPPLGCLIPLAVALCLPNGVFAEPPPRASVSSAPDPTVLRSGFDLIEQGRYEEARAILEPVVAAHPDWARARFYLALAHHKQHRYEQAKEHFQRALELDASYRPIRLFYGWCLYYLGELERSKEMFLSYLSDRPDDADTHFALGLIELDRDNVDAARKRFLKAIELARTQKDAATEAKAQARLGDVLMRSSDLEAARKVLQRSVELNSDNPEVWFKLSLVLQRTGDADGARKAREKYETLRDRVRLAESAERRPVR